MDTKIVPMAEVTYDPDVLTMHRNSGVLLADLSDLNVPIGIFPSAVLINFPKGPVFFKLDKVEGDQESGNMVFEYKPILPKYLGLKKLVLFND